MTINASKKHLLITIAFVVVAAALRFYRLEDQSLWNDEMFSFDAASRSFAEIQPRLIEYYHHPPLFFYFAHIALSLFGLTAWGLRSVSAISGALTVGVVYAVGRKLFGNTAGIAAGILCLISPFHIAYSQEGRPYALAALLCLLSFYSFLLFLNERKVRWGAAYVITSVALLYTHHWGIFVLAAHAIYVLINRESRRNNGKWILISWLAIALAYIPELPALHHQDVATSASTWFWSQSPSAVELWHLLAAFAGTYFNMASSIFSLPLVLQLFGAISIAVLLVLVAVNALSRPAFQFVMICLSGILLIPFAISFLKPEVFLWYRYTVIAFPLLCVAISGTIGQPWKIKEIFASIAVVCVVLCSAAGTVQYFTNWQKANVRDVASYVSEVTHKYDVDIIIRPAKFASLFNYYYRDGRLQLDEAYLNTPLGEIVDTARSFIYVSLDVPNEIRSYMDGHFDKVAEEHFPGEAHMGMLVSVYQQKPDMDDSQ